MGVIVNSVKSCLRKHVQFIISSAAVRNSILIFFHFNPQICYALQVKYVHKRNSTENHTPWRNSNPGFLLLWRMRSPLRNTARGGKLHIYILLRNFIVLLIQKYCNYHESRCTVQIKNANMFKLF
jgi:hypothetical protein